MPTARTRANRKYNEKAYARIALTIPKGKKEAVEDHAKRKGESINGLINRLIREDMGLSVEEWKSN